MIKTIIEEDYKKKTLCKERYDGNGIGNATEKW